MQENILLHVSLHEQAISKLIVPQRAHSWSAAAARHSYYAEPLEAGVQLYEYVGGLLHAKTIMSMVSFHSSVPPISTGAASS